MTDSLGLSIGMTNLVAARVGNPPVTRRAVLNLFRNRAPEVGVPSENPNLTEPGLMLSGFVERVGDPVPIVAADGSSHQADRLLVEALDAMVHTVNGATAPSNVTIAVPAHWGPAVIGALRSTLRVKPNLSPNGVPAPLIPDSVAALAALKSNPGLPDSGVVALLDFGGSGTSITLADAGTGLQPIDETTRYSEFSGELIDQALLTHVLADINQSGQTDASSTTDVRALANLREQARLAKERLSAQTATELPVALPGYHSDIRVTRSELEQLIRAPFAGVIAAFEELLERNRIQVTNLSAVATVGGGAAIPLVTQLLSERFRVQMVTAPHPALVLAAGAAVLAARGVDADATGLAVAPDAATGLAAAADAPTGMSTAGWAAGAAGVAATESASDGASSATFRALAWSQEDGTGDDVVPYTGADYTYEPPTGAGARPAMEFLPPDQPPPPVEAPLPWYRRPQLLFAAAAVALLLVTSGLVYTLTSGSRGTSGPRPETSQAVTNPETPGAPLTETVTVTGSNGSPTVVTPPPPPGSSTTQPGTTTSSPTTSTTTTTTAPTTTSTTTTQPTTTTRPTTTTAPPTTTQAPPTTTAAPPTTTADIPTTTIEPPTVIPDVPDIGGGAVPGDS